MEFSYSQNELIKLLNPDKIVGNTKANITRISPLLEAKEGDISFLGNSKYKKDVKCCNASILLLPNDYCDSPKDGQCFFLCDNPSFSLGVLCSKIETEYSAKRSVGISKSSVIDESAVIGENVTIGANVIIEQGAVIADNVIISAGCYIGCFAKIGKYSILHPAVTVMDFCEIGERVILSPGVVIGADGFGYETVNGVHIKIPQIGNVVIQDDVHIGANTTIDRARFSHTLIGKGTKIDNLVQIGHNVKVGENCLIVSQTGIAGSTEIGNYVVIGGQVGIAGHLTIGNGAVLAGKSAVSKDCQPKEVLRGNPAVPINEANRLYVLRKRIPELFKRVSALEDTIKETDEQLH